jgi:hypothetical protein
VSRRPCRPGHVRSRPPRWRCATSRQMDRSAVPRFAEAHGSPRTDVTKSVSWDPGGPSSGTHQGRIGQVPRLRGTAAGESRRSGAARRCTGCSVRKRSRGCPSAAVHPPARARWCGRAATQGDDARGYLHQTPPASSRVSRRQAAPRCAGDRPGDRSVGPRRGSSVEPARWCTGRPGRRGASTERSRAPSDRRRRGDGPRVLELRPWAASPLRAGRLRVRRLPARPRAAAGATG